MVAPPVRPSAVTIFRGATNPPEPYLVQSTVFPANDHFMELLFWIDALRRASAESVTVVMPYGRVVKISVLGCTASAPEYGAAPARYTAPLTVFTVLRSSR